MNLLILNKQGNQGLLEVGERIWKAQVG